MSAARELMEMLRGLERDLMAAQTTGKRVMDKIQDVKAHVVAYVITAKSAHGHSDIDFELAHWMAAYPTLVVRCARAAMARATDSLEYEQRSMRDWIFVLEDAAMTVFQMLRGNAEATNQEESTPTSASAVSLGVSSHGAAHGGRGVDPVLLRSAYIRVLDWYSHLEKNARNRRDGTSRQQSACIAWVQLGQLIACTWLRLAPDLYTTHALALLQHMVDHRAAMVAVGGEATWPLFLLAMVHLVEKRDALMALEFMRRASRIDPTSQSDSNARGVFHYWFAVILIANGDRASARDELRQAVRFNYHPVSSLNLSAFLSLKENDRYSASDALERCIEINFEEAVTIFNYAILLRGMENTNAQYQMLQYFAEATTETTISKAPNELPEAYVPALLFPKNKTTTLLPCIRTDIDQPALCLQMAMAAMDNASWVEARSHFEVFFKFVQEGGITNQVLSVEDATKDYIYVLLQCNRPADALELCEHAIRKSSLRDGTLCLPFFKADALLCLERVDECHTYMKNKLEPAMMDQLRDATNKELVGEIAMNHIQLLNNLAIATVCQGNLSRGVSLLREAAKRYPKALSITFNLVLLLWRSDQRETACLLWCNVRGWKLPTNVETLGDHQVALDLLSRIEAKVLSSTAPPIRAHVYDCDTNGGVDEQQLLYADALMLHHWGNSQNVAAMQITTQYIEYLESVSTRLGA